MTNPPPLYDTLYPIVVDYLNERGMMVTNKRDAEWNSYHEQALVILDHLLDGEDGLGYRIWTQAYDRGRKDEESDTYEWNRLD